VLPPDVAHVLRLAARTRRRIRRWTRILAVLAAGLLAWLAIDAAILLDPAIGYAAAGGMWERALLLTLAGSAVAALSAWFPKETPERAARRVDAAGPVLGEALEAIVYLEPKRDEPFAASYSGRIARRVSAILRRDGVPYPYGRERRWALGLGALCVAAIAVLVQVERKVDPWGALLADTAEMAEAGDALEAPDAAAPEVAREWGEVRITAPGRDLRVTKVDVVPLEIEAAASDALVRARWFTAVSGADDVEHLLPKPADRHHALFTPHLYVDELRLSDWDVVAYHAGASTSGGRVFSSGIYFLEIRPFREEILKLEAGGEARQNAFALLGEISGLIDRQKHVVRETHQHLRDPRRNADDQRSDRAKLGAAESDVLEASDHLYARIAAEMENQPVAEVLDELALAQADLSAAVAAFDTPEGDPLVDEQSALQHLVASRKAFHKVISEMGDGSADAEAGEAEAGLADQIREMAELRNERAAVRDEVKALLEAQRALADRVEKTGKDALPPLGAEQGSLLEELTGLSELHPRAFERSKEALEAAREALSVARDVLKAAEPGAATQRDAVTRLETLHASLAAQARRGDQTDAYELQKALEATKERLREAEANPASLSEAEARKLAAETRSAARALDDAAPGGLPGLPGLENALDSLSGAADDSARSRAAGDARRALEQIEADLDRRMPELVRKLRESNPLRESPDAALDETLERMRALADETEKREQSPEDRAAARRDILDGLAPGLTRLYGAAEARSVLAQVEAELAGEGFDPERLRDLVARIENRRVEIREAAAREADEQLLVRKDPTRLAPAYRRRVEEYFRRLSER
jgi:hypothetical protein